MKVLVGGIIKKCSRYEAKCRFYQMVIISFDSYFLLRLVLERQSVNDEEKDCRCRNYSLILRRSETHACPSECFLKDVCSIPTRSNRNIRNGKLVNIAVI